MSAHAINRARVSLDEEDWTVVVELVKLRFAELVENGQASTGDIRAKNFKAAADLWDIIKDIELQLPTHRRPDTASTAILGPLRDWRAALKALAPDLTEAPKLIQSAAE